MQRQQRQAELEENYCQVVSLRCRHRGMSTYMRELAAASLCTSESTNTIFSNDFQPTNSHVYTL